MAASGSFGTPRRDEIPVNHEDPWATRMAGRPSTGGRYGRSGLSAAEVIHVLDALSRGDGNPLRHMMRLRNGLHGDEYHMALRLVRVQPRPTGPPEG